MGVPENIDALLVKFDINQDGLARIANVAPSAVSRWRKGARPRMSAIKNICDELGLTEDDILSDVAGLAAKVLQVEGQCMSKIYPEGSYILIDPMQRPVNGSIAVVSIDGADYVMRRLYKGSSVLVLSPDSWEEGYDDIVIAGDDHTVEFVGSVVWFQASGELE